MAITVREKLEENDDTLPERSSPGSSQATPEKFEQKPETQSSPKKKPFFNESEDDFMPTKSPEKRKRKRSSSLGKEKVSKKAREELKD